jgi:hypothetical protein
MNIELRDDRIEAIRSKVLDEVDADITARGRRVRRRIAGGVGALALLVVAGVAGPSLLGPSPGGPEQSADMATADRGMGGPAPEVGMAPPEGAADAMLAEKAPSDPGDNREIITTGSASVSVKDPVGAAERFSGWVRTHEGRIDGRNEHRDEQGHTSATLQVRLPANRVESAIKQLRQYGDVEEVSLDRFDVTAQGRDLDARIKALKVSVGRLEAILARGATTDQVIAAETALSERQQELESLESERRALTEQVSLSSISVSFLAKDRADSVTPDGFLGGLIRGWNSLINAVNGIVTGAGILAPWIGVAVVVWIGWRFVRRLRNRSDG